MAGAGKWIKDKALLLTLALVITAPLLLAVWAWPRDPATIETRKQLERLPEDEHLVVARYLDDDAISALPRLKQLQEFQLYYGEITDAGMAHLARCESLEVLTLSAEKVTDAGLARLAMLSRLNSLTLAGMPEISDTGLEVLARLPALRRLAIIRCPRVGPQLHETLSQLDLVYLDLEQTRLVGDAAAHGIARNRALKVLNLNFCEALGDEGIALIATLPSLEELHLHSIPRMTDESLKALAQLKTLKVLELPLHTARITPEGISALKTALPNCKINC